LSSGKGISVLTGCLGKGFGVELSVKCIKGRHG
jgi:hypothetical protein